MPAYLQLLSMKQPRLRVHGENDQGFVLVSMLVDDGQGMMDVGEDLVRIGMATELAGKSASTPQSSANAAAQVRKPTIRLLHHYLSDFGKISNCRCEIIRLKNVKTNIADSSS